MGDPHQAKGNQDHEIGGHKTHYQIAQPHGDHADTQNQDPAVLQLVNQKPTSDGSRAATDTPYGVHQPGGNRRQAQLGVEDRQDDIEAVVICVV